MTVCNCDKKDTCNEYTIAIGSICNSENFKACNFYPIGLVQYLKSLKTQKDWHITVFFGVRMDNNKFYNIKFIAMNPDKQSFVIEATYPNDELTKLASEISDEVNTELGALFS
jgi:hypothetical protein